MMERKYQLVAWTENITDKEDARLYMIPSLECEVQADLVTDLTFIHREEYKFHGPISLDLARRAVRAYENMSRFEILAGHPGDGIRYIICAARYCIMEDDLNWAYYDTDLARKYRREDILQEVKPKQMLELYFEHTQEERDLNVHMKEVEAWK